VNVRVTFSTPLTAKSLQSLGQSRVDNQNLQATATTGLDEVALLLQAVPGPKFKAALATAYGAVISPLDRLARRPARNRDRPRLSRGRRATLTPKPMASGHAATSQQRPQPPCTRDLLRSPCKEIEGSLCS